MKTMELETIRKELPKKFTAEELEIAGMNIQPSPFKSEALATLEKELRCKFPVTFSGLLMKYDLGNLTLGPIQFGYESNYLELLLEWNKEETSGAWWGDGARPNNWIAIAFTDPYILILDTASEEIHGFLHEEGWKAHRRVASDSESLLRGLGTLILQRKPSDKNGNLELGKTIAASVTSADEAFWLNIAS